MKATPTELWLIRHGETEWSLTGQHTSRTDIPLTEHGRESAIAMGADLREQSFSLVLTSPRQRAIETCRLAGLGDTAYVDDNLREWDYGEYEGRTTDEIRQQKPGWTIWDGTPPGGESLDSVAARCRSVIDRALVAGGRVALFSHAHLLRILAATWLGLPPQAGRLFALTTSSVSRLGFERETHVIERWNHAFGVE